jgi:CRISPR-associated endonuclease/helicase Cas3
MAQGTVIVFRPETFHLPPGPYRTGTMLAETMLLEGTLDLDDPQTYRTYFERYYARINRDEPRVQEVRRALNYPEVARRFRLLQEESTPVVVSYHPPDQPLRLPDLLTRLRQHPEQRRLFFRQVQPYLVNLRASEKAWAQEKGYLEPIVAGLLLWTGPYDSLYGIQTDQEGDLPLHHSVLSHKQQRK